MAISTPHRPQPPSIRDPEAGDFDDFPIRVDEEEEGAGYLPDTDDNSAPEGPNWMKRAKDAYRFSTSYVDSNYRRQWEDSIRAFHSQHAGDSKYNSPLWNKRSNIFRPKTRSVIRKNEAAGAAAFFSNVDRISVQGQNEAKPEQRLSAAIMKALLQYRLTKSIPWFHVVIGGLQDAQVQGTAAAHVHWKYETNKNRHGELEITKDMPKIDLIPIENLRIDPAAHWMDPVNDSPYLIHLMPMYVCDVKEKMRQPDPKGRKWKHVDDHILAAARADDDTTRAARDGVSEEPTQQRRNISDYDVVWIHRHIHRWNGQDWEFYTLASERLLTDPEPLSNTVFHGKRPYVIGVSILETHKPLSSSVPKLVEGLQAEANEVANQRLDNVKFVLNKRWMIRRGANVDIASLVRNVPGGITMADKVGTEDIQEVNWQDVTSSAYEEQNRIDADFSDLAGNFDPMQVQGSKLGQPSENTMRMLQGPSNLLTEYMLKTYVETFVQPILRLLVLLEQHYETDQTIMELAGEKAEAFQKFGKDEITDDMLDHEMTVSVNVGMGATDPVMRLQRFVYTVQSFAQICVRPPPGISLTEVAKEMFGLSGYQDGERFMTDTDPDKQHAQQLIGQLTMKLKELMSKVKEKEQSAPVKLAIARDSNLTKERIEAAKHGREGALLLAKHILEVQKMQITPASPPLDPNKQQAVAGDK